MLDHNRSAISLSYIAWLMAGLRSNPCPLFQQIEKQQGRHGNKCSIFSRVCWHNVTYTACCCLVENVHKLQTFFLPSSSQSCCRSAALSRSTTHSSTSSARVWLLITTREKVLLRKRQHDRLLMKTGVWEIQHQSIDNNKTTVVVFQSTNQCFNSILW